MVEEVIKNARISANGRRLFTSDQKVYIVEAWEASGMSAPEFCRRYGLITTIIYTWRKNSKRGAVMGVQNDGNLHSKTEVDTLKKENEQLKLALAEAELDKRILKKKIEMDEQAEKKLNLFPGSLE
jgi:transposase-like protein